MADSSLDDFFAKKDKSKKKSKSKMTPVDVLSKADETQKVKKKKAQEKPGGLGLATSETTTKKDEEDEEWKDFEEQKEVDYSGLRIHTLQIREDEEKDAGDSDEQGEGEDGEERREGATGPWNKSTATPSPAAAPAPVPEPEEKKENTAPKKYVPPAQRMAALNPIKRGKKEAPNIQSEEDFPTLGGMPGGPSGSSSAWGAKKYEDSGAGDIESNPGQRRGVNLSLENKYAALQD
ncbi:hypothetical protein BaRGS_00026371 [Batillaria attramentaria]|uniref:Protein CDV3 homolog n=1 Tax=Batillaria attramentaria TaxID=370345 RepID=A0ABD0K5K5_9CAEN